MTNVVFNIGISTRVRFEIETRVAGRNRRTRRVQRRTTFSRVNSCHPVTTSTAFVTTESPLHPTRRICPCPLASCPRRCPATAPPKVHLEEFALRDVPSKRRREVRLDRPRVQQEERDGVFLPRELDGAVFRELIQRRLARAVGVPPAEPIVADAAHPRAEVGHRGGRGARLRGEPGRLREQPREVFGHEGRAERVDAVGAKGGGLVESRERRLGLSPSTCNTAATFRMTSTRPWEAATTRRPPPRWTGRR